MFLEASCRTSERHVRTRFMHVTLGAESFSFASTAGSLSCGGVAREVDFALLGLQRQCSISLPAYFAVPYVSARWHEL